MVAARLRVASPVGSGMIRHTSVTRGQRGWKGQPSGRRRSEGVEPGIWFSGWPGAASEGSESRRPRV